MEISRTKNKLVVTLPDGTVRTHEGGADLLDREEAYYRAQCQQSHAGAAVANQQSLFYGQLPQFGQRNLFALPTLDQRDLLDLPSTANVPEDSPESSQAPASFGQPDYAAPLVNYAPPAGALVTNEDTLDLPSTFEPLQAPAIGVLGARATRTTNRQEQRSQTAPAAVAGDTMDTPSWSF